MTAQHKNLVLDHGASFKQSFRYKDSNDNTVDLTGFSAVFYVYKRGDSSMPIKTVTCSVTADGYIQAYISDEQTELMSLGVFAYALELEDTNGDIDRLLFGQLTVRGAANV